MIKIAWCIFVSAWIVSIGIIRAMWALFDEVCKAIDKKIDDIFEGL